MHSKPNKKTVKKLDHIDSLRGVAIIMVIMLHVAQTQPHFVSVINKSFIYGKFGVQLFFFLSAYTLCMSMKQRAEKDAIIKFYIRRFFRIAPLYYFGIVVYYLISFIAIPGHPKPFFPHKYYTHFNIVANIFFLHGFVPSANNTIVPGGWSIGAEMLFYLAFPMFFYIYTKTKKLIYLPIAALVIANLFTLVMYTKVGAQVFNDTFYYYNIFTQLPVFAVGMYFYFMEKKFKKTSALVNLGCFTVLLLTSFVLFLKIHNNKNICLTIAAISFCFLFRWFADQKFHLKLLNRIGQLSFSMYIFHFLIALPVSFMFTDHLKAYVNPYLLLIACIFITISLSMLISVFSEKVIEKPGIKLGKKLISLYDKKLLKPLPSQQVNQSEAN
jgi:peptidoglycan/LPS O-acetylase OafA/YrhL